MSHKTLCPVCESYTSSIYEAFANGNPCPSCGLSAETAAEITRRRSDFADAELSRAYEAASVRADRAESEVARLREVIEDIRFALPGRDTMTSPLTPESAPPVPED